MSSKNKQYEEHLWSQYSKYLDNEELEREKMNWNKEIENIENWTKEYLEKSECKGYVLGVSGGIDSSVCLSILKRSVLVENIKAVALPCNSNKDSLIDAQKLADNLRIKLEVINLENSFNTIIENLKSINNNEISPLVKGNIAARLRMVQLYSIANQNNMLVIGTCNKSELMISYGTKFGDLSSDIEIIGEWYKTQIYEMTDFMPEVPSSIINKKPSADLWKNQSDESEIGFNYPTLDKILQRWEVDSGKYTDYNDGITEEDFNKVSSMIRNSKHKRKMPPICPKL